MRIAAALLGARALGIARLDAQLLLAHLLQQRREWLLAHDEAELSPAQDQAWQALQAYEAAEQLAALELASAA